MAGNKRLRDQEYRALLATIMTNLDGDCEVDEFMMNTLKAAKKAMDHVGNQDPKVGKKTGKAKPKASDEQRVLQLNAAKAVWTSLLQPFTTRELVDNHAFEGIYTFSGSQGFDKFTNDVRKIFLESINKEEVPMANAKKEVWKTELGKPQGWIENIGQDMADLIWANLEKNLDATEKADVLGLEALWAYKKELLVNWSKALLNSRRDSNVRYGSKEVVGPMNIKGAKGGACPSHVIPNVMPLYFLKPEQVEIAHKVRKGIQGEINICHIQNLPLIPNNTKLVAKTFLEGELHKQRASALQEVLMGGLNHKGVVGALGMTIDDPPTLIYGYYNGGDLGNFINNCAKWRKDKGKSKMEPEHIKFIFRRKLFLENRLGIAMVLSQTMQFLHDSRCVHYDLHSANVFLHFDEEDEMPKKVYVGVGDFGMSKSLNQCGEKSHRMFKVVAAEVENFRAQYTQVAPELVGPKKGGL